MAMFNKINGNILIYSFIFITYNHTKLWASLTAQTVKNMPACRCGRPRFNPWVGKIPWGREWLPTPVFLPGEFHEQWSLMGSIYIYIYIYVNNTNICQCS